jgi:hypothetical protein
MKKVVRIKESELVNLIDKIITETTRKQKISEGVRNLAGKQIIKERLSYDDFEQMIKPFLELAKSKGWVWNSDGGNSWVELFSPAIALYHKDVLPTTKDGEYKGNPKELGTDPVVSRQTNYRGPLETKNADVIMTPDADMEQAYFYAKDKTILNNIKDRMASYVDVIQDIKQISSEFITAKYFEPQNYYYMLLRKKQQSQK